MNNFLDESIKVAVIFALVPVGIIVFGFLLKKLGAKQLPQTKIDEILHKSFPKIYSKIYIFLVLMLIGIPIVGMFVSIRLFQSLQNLLFGNGVIFLTSGTGLNVFVLLNFFASLFFIGSIIGIAIWQVSSSKFRDYLLYRQIKSRLKIDYMDASKYLLYFSIGLYMLFAPLFYLSFHNYYAVYKDRIVVNNFFDLFDKEYSFDQLNNVYVGYAIKGEEKDEIHPSLIFTFSDGRKTNFTEDVVNILYTNNVGSSVSNLYQEIESRGISLEINPPNEREISLIREHSCRNKQEMYQVVFRLDFPTAEPKGWCLSIF